MVSSTLLDEDHEKESFSNNALKIFENDTINTSFEISDDEFLSYVQSMTSIPSLSSYDPIESNESSFSYDIQFQKERIEKMLDSYANNRIRLEGEIKDYPEESTKVIHDTEALKDDHIKHSKDITENTLTWKQLTKQRDNYINLGRKSIRRLSEIKSQYSEEILSNPTYALRQYHEQLKQLVHQLSNKLTKTSSELTAIKNREQLWKKNTQEKDDLLVTILKREEAIVTKLRAKISELYLEREEERRKVEELFESSLQNGVGIHIIFQNYKASIKNLDKTRMEREHSKNEVPLNSRIDRYVELLSNESGILNEKTKLEQFLSKFSDQLKERYIEGNPDTTILERIKEVKTWMQRKGEDELILRQYDLDELFLGSDRLPSSLPIPSRNVYGAGNFTQVSYPSPGNIFTSVEGSHPKEKFQKFEKSYSSTLVDGDQIKQCLDSKTEPSQHDSQNRLNNPIHADAQEIMTFSEAQGLSVAEKTLLAESLTLNNRIHEVVEGVPQSHFSPREASLITSSPKKRPTSKSNAKMKRRNSHGEIYTKPPSRSNISRNCSTKDIHTQTNGIIDEEDHAEGIAYIQEQLQSLEESKTNVRKLEKDLDSTVQRYEEQKTIFEEQVRKKDEEIKLLKKLLAESKRKRKNNLSSRSAESNLSYEEPQNSSLDPQSLFSPLLDPGSGSRNNSATARVALNTLQTLSEAQDQESTDWKEELKPKNKKKPNAPPRVRKYHENVQIASDVVTKHHSFEGVVESDYSSLNEFLVKVDPHTEVSVNPTSKRERLNSQEQLKGSHMNIHPHPSYLRKRFSLPVSSKERFVIVDAQIERVIDRPKVFHSQISTFNSNPSNDDTISRDISDIQHSQFLQKSYAYTPRTDYSDMSSRCYSSNRSNSTDHNDKAHLDIPEKNIRIVTRDSPFYARDIVIEPTHSRSSSPFCEKEDCKYTRSKVNLNRNITPSQAIPVGSTFGSSQSLEMLEELNNTTIGNGLESTSSSPTIPKRKNRNKFLVHISTGGSAPIRRHSILPSIARNKASTNKKGKYPRSRDKIYEKSK